MIHEQKMKKEFPDYPCANCTVVNKEACDWRKCAKYNCWFTKWWGKFRETGKLIKAQEKQQPKVHEDVSLRDIEEIVKGISKQE